MKSYTIEVMVTDDIAEQLNQACETLNKKGYFFSSEKMMDLAIFLNIHYELLKELLCNILPPA